MKAAPGAHTAMVRGTGAAHPVPGPPVTSALREVWSDLAALYMALLTPEAMAARLDRALVLLLAAPIGTPSDGVGPPPLPWVLWGVAGGRALWANLVRERGEDGARETMRERARNGGKASRGKRAFTETQDTVLEAAYARNWYPERDAVQEIADKAGLTKQQVYQWFVHKRQRDNRELARRGKRAFTETQYTVLEAEYAENRCPERDAVQMIVGTADLTEQQVYQWFVNKRHRERKRRKCR